MEGDLRRITMLPVNCTIQDVRNASIEVVYNSYRYADNYSTDVVMEMARILRISGL